MGSHTIVLLQRRPGDTKSRTYLHFESVPAAALGIVQMYENLLKELNPGQTHINYDLDQLFAWLDKLGDCSALVHTDEVRYATTNTDFQRCDLELVSAELAFRLRARRSLCPRLSS